MNDNVEEIVRPYKPLEPEALKVDDMPVEDSLYSIAISLKRIADALEVLNDPNKPMNVYGEGWADALQNGIARGLQGINTAELRR